MPAVGTCSASYAQLDEAHQCRARYRQIDVTEKTRLCFVLVVNFKALTKRLVCFITTQYFSGLAKWLGFAQDQQSESFFWWQI